MKIKRYLHGVTFYLDTEMYDAIKHISDQRQISLSELLRELIGKYLGAADEALANSEK